MPMLTALVIAMIAAAAYAMARAKAIASAQGDLPRLHSRPDYHGVYAALWVCAFGFGTLIAAHVATGAALDAHLRGMVQALSDATSNRMSEDLIMSDARAIATGGLPSATDAVRETIAASYAKLSLMRGWGVAAAAILAALIAAWRTLRQISVDWRARNRAERMIRVILAACAAIAVLTTIGIVFSLIGETLRFFHHVPFWKFLFGTNWSPLAGVFDGKIDENQVGILPLFAGTLMITLAAMLVAAPVGLFAAIYLSDFAGARVRAWVKPMLEILAGIPTVVYGFFAAITVSPIIRGSGEALGLNIASESALAAGLVMGIMIIPFISSLSDDVLNAVPQSLRDGSYALGATKAETIRQVVLPAALPGIVSALLLGVSRAVGETMIVVMAAGQGANLTWNPFEAVTTVTVQIVALITGDTEADTAAGPAFALGFTLFCITLALNVIALRFVRKYRELYD